MNHILIIEDDRDIREGIRFLLEGAGYMVSEAPNGRDGLSLFDEDVDLVILDIMMPGLSGLQVCEEIRKRSYVPVLFLTARAKESDKLTGFTVGGDDYLVKPFSHAELFARVKALLRRRQVYDKEPGKVNEGTETLQCCASTADCTINEKNESRFDSAQRWLEINSVRINTVYNQVFIRGQEVALTESEYKILLLLMSYPTKIFSIQNLYDSIWGEPFLSASANTVMVHIRNLRKKIEENPQKPKIVQTVWGKGYRLG